MSRVGKFGRLILTSPDGGTLLRTVIWDQILRVDELVRSITVEHEGEERAYAWLCARWGGSCRWESLQINQDNWTINKLGSESGAKWLESHYWVLTLNITQRNGGIVLK